VAALFALARVFLGNAAPAAGEDPLALAAALFAHAPSLDEAAVTINTGSLKAPELALLFSLLSVY
jgi:hypothetical protein